MYLGDVSPGRDLSTLGTGVIKGKRKRGRKRESAALEAGEPEPEAKVGWIIKALKSRRASVAWVYQSAGCGE